MGMFDLTVGVLVFILVFVMTCRILRRATEFQGLPHRVVAFCVAALSVIGLLRTFGLQDSASQLVSVSRGPAIDALLIPYAALGLTLLILFILMGIFGLAHRPRRKPDQSGEKSRHVRDTTNEQSIIQNPGDSHHDNTINH